MTLDVNAKQLKTVDLTKVDQSQSYQFNDDQYRRAAACEAVQTKLGKYLSAWLTSISEFDEAYRKERLVQDTATLERLDGERDPVYTGLYGSVKQARKSPVTAQVEAAEALWEVLTRYKVDVAGEYQQETMRIAQLCQELLGSARLTKHLQTLGLKEWAEALQAKNQEFQTAMNERTNAQAGYQYGLLKEKRAAMEQGYKNFRTMLNAVSLYEGDEEYASLIDQMNAEVDHYKQIIARHQAVLDAKKNKKKQEGGGDVTPEPEPEPDPDGEQDEEPEE